MTCLRIHCGFTATPFGYKLRSRLPQHHLSRALTVFLLLARCFAEMINDSLDKMSHKMLIASLIVKPVVATR